MQISTSKFIGGLGALVLATTIANGPQQVNAQSQLYSSLAANRSHPSYVQPPDSTIPQEKTYRLVFDVESGYQVDLSNFLLMSRMQVFDLVVNIRQ